MFYALVVGKDEGCGYTIGCNRVWVRLEAHSWDEARLAAAALVRQYQEPRLAEVTILEVVSRHKVDVAGIYEQAKEEALANKQAALEEDERRQYERLRAKYGPVKEQTVSKCIPEEGGQ